MVPTSDDLHLWGVPIEQVCLEVDVLNLVDGTSTTEVTCPSQQDIDAWYAQICEGCATDDVLVVGDGDDFVHGCQGGSGGATGLLPALALLALLAIVARARQRFSL